MKVTKNYYIKGVKLEGATIEDYVALRKHQNDFTVEDHVRHTAVLDAPEYATAEEEIRTLWDKIEPMPYSEIFKRFSSNSQVFMVLMSIINPELILKNMGAEVVDQQSVNKIQKRTFLKEEGSLEDVVSGVRNKRNEVLMSDMFSQKEVEFNDVYTIHKIAKEKFGPQMEEDVHVLECKCPSTHNHYFLFIDYSQPQCQDAIGAVAWTMVKDNGECLNKEEYLKLQYES